MRGQEQTSADIVELRPFEPAVTLAAHENDRVSVAPRKELPGNGATAAVRGISTARRRRTIRRRQWSVGDVQLVDAWSHISEVRRHVQAVWEISEVNRRAIDRFRHRLLPSRPLPVADVDEARLRVDPGSEGAIAGRGDGPGAWSLWAAVRRRQGELRNRTAWSMERTRVLACIASEQQAVARSLRAAVPASDSDAESTQDVDRPRRPRE